MIIEIPDNIDFTSAYETKLVGAMLRDHTLLTGYRLMFSPKLFTCPEKQQLATMVLDFYDTHDNVPSIETIEQLVADLCRDFPDHAKKRPLYDLILKQAAEMRVDDNEVMIEKIRRHALSMGMVRAVSTHCSKGRVSNKDLDALVKEIEDLQAKLDDQNQIGTVWQDKWHEFLGNTREGIISTGWPKLDEVCGGGVAAGEMILVLAPPKVGKSLFCTALGSNVAQLGMDVVHVSLEMGEREVMARYTSNILGMVPIGSAFEAVREKLMEQARAITSRIFVLPFPMRGCPPDTLRSALRTMVKQGRLRKGKFLLIVDYPTIMQPIARENTRHVVADSYSGCLQIAREFEVPLIAPMQANRQAWRHAQATTDIENAAESADPVRDAHFVWAMRQTDDQRQEGTLDIFVAASRHTSARETVRFGVDYAHYRLADLDD